MSGSAQRRHNVGPGCERTAGAPLNARILVPKPRTSWLPLQAGCRGLGWAPRKCSALSDTWTCRIIGWASERTAPSSQPATTLMGGASRGRPAQAWMDGAQQHLSSLGRPPRCQAWCRWTYQTIGCKVSLLRQHSVAWERVWRAVDCTLSCATRTIANALAQIPFPPCAHAHVTLIQCL